MARVADQDQILSKRKAISALFPYALWLERGGDHRMADAYLGIVRVPRVGRAVPHQIVTLFNEARPDLPNRVMTLMSPYIPWELWSDKDTLVTQWAAAALAAPYTEETGQSVVDTLLQIVSNESLTPYIPVDIWVWLKKQPLLPPICRGRSMGTSGHVVRRVRELGDVEILESYLLLVWSEWDYIHMGGFAEMSRSIREDLGGIGMGPHREVLIKRLDHILGQLDRGLRHLKQQNTTLDEENIVTAKRQYRRLKEVLLEVDRGVLKILTRTSFRFINLFSLLTPVDAHRISLDVYLCAPSPMSIVARPYHLFLVPPTTHFVRTDSTVASSSSIIYIYHAPTTTAKPLKTYAPPAASRHEKYYVDVLCGR